VLMGNNNGGEGVRIFARELHAFMDFTARNAGVHQNAGARALYNGAVTTAATSQPESETPMRPAYSQCLWKRE